ncbi:MAG TPA: hydroxymethylbilane synthase [Acidobacteriaceae bacterium]|jgi:hydroxymethylbilane synthase|nr:hydroxymethylbilane synthase [Acidobacteriaceae bacterium]
MNQTGMIRIGSRGSQLALWQAEHVAGLLRERGHEVEIEVIKTTGDRMQEVTFAEVGSKGMFTLEIEEALAAGRVDLAVHSLKDLPTELPADFVLGATPARVDARDVLVSKDFASLQALPEGARVGTSSLRRRAQLRHLRPDLEFTEFRGNVDTRLRKLGEGKAEAIVLAAAGLDRLDKTEWIRERIDVEAVCPAAGQGALGIEIRASDPRMSEVVAFLDDPATRFAVTAERIALAALGGGCQVPIGVHCWPGSSGGFEILGVVADPDGSKILRSSASGDDADELGRAVAVDLLQQGASELFEGIGTH